MCQAEDDLLPCHYGSGSPFGEGLLRRLNGRLQLCISALRDSGDEVIGRGIMEIDPGRSLGRDKLIVDKVGRVRDLLDLCMGSRVVCLCSGSSGQVFGGSMESARGRLLCR